jgi:BlaI family transcriptional regulator, penicillinase repressor
MDDEESQDVSLSDLQLAIMRALWAKPGSSTADVVEALRTERSLAHTTVATLLTRLEKRGLVISSREGRQLIYRAAVSESQVKRSMVSGLLSSLFAGDARALLTHLLREDEIKASDLEQMRALLNKKGKHDA